MFWNMSGRKFVGTILVNSKSRNINFRHHSSNLFPSLTRTTEGEREREKEESEDISKVHLQHFYQTNHYFFRPKIFLRFRRVETRREIHTFKCSAQNHTRISYLLPNHRQRDTASASMCISLLYSCIH